MSSPALWSLSIEEMAVGLSLLGRPELARTLLSNQYGEIGADDERGRLMAANNTLCVRGWLTIDGNGRPHLDPQLRQALEAVVRQDYLLRCSRNSGGKEEVLAYYVTPEITVEHSIGMSGVAHHLAIADAGRIVEKVTEFLGAGDDPLPAITPATFSHAVLTEASNDATQSAAAAQATLNRGGVAEPMAGWFAEDLFANDYRASLLRVDMDAQGAAIADRGFLALRGRGGRVWLLRVILENNNANIVATLANREVIQTAVRELL